MNEKKIINGLKNTKNSLLLSVIMLGILMIPTILSKDKIASYIIVCIFFLLSLIFNILSTFIKGYEKE